MGRVRIETEMTKEEPENSSLIAGGGGFSKDGKMVLIPATGKMIWFTEEGLRRAAAKIAAEE